MIAFLADLALASALLAFLAWCGHRPIATHAAAALPPKGTSC